MVKVDLFGASSDEKEVTKIAGKTVEARGNKSYNTLHIVAEFVTEKSLLNLIIPFKDVCINFVHYVIIIYFVFFFSFNEIDIIFNIIIQKHQKVQ